MGGDCNIQTRGVKCVKNAVEKHEGSGDYLENMEVGGMIILK
jgi:hypothetical protein